MLFLLSQLHHNFLNLFPPFQSTLPPPPSPLLLMKIIFNKTKSMQTGETFSLQYSSSAWQPDGIIFLKMILLRAVKGLGWGEGGKGAHSRRRLMKYWILLDWKLLALKRSRAGLALRDVAECKVHRKVHQTSTMLRTLSTLKAINRRDFSLFKVIFRDIELSFSANDSLRVTSSHKRSQKAESFQLSSPCVYLFIFKAEEQKVRVLKPQRK